MDDREGNYLKIKNVFLNAFLDQKSQCPFPLPRADGYIPTVFTGVLSDSQVLEQGLKDSKFPLYYINGLPICSETET